MWQKFRGGYLGRSLWTIRIQKRRPCIHPNAGRATVIGVAPATEGKDPEPLVLWCAFDEDGGTTVAYSYRLNLTYARYIRKQHRPLLPI